MYESYQIATQPPPSRFDFFRDTLDRVFCPMQVLPRSPRWEPFAGCIEVSSLGSIRIAKVATQACVVRRREEDIAHLTEVSYLVKFQTRGESHWCQRNREVHLRPGDFVVCSTAEPYRLEFNGSYEMPVLALSAETMARITPDPDQFLGRRMDGEDADNGLLSGFVAQVAGRMRQLSAPVAARAEANILDLLGAVLSARSRARSTRVPPEQQVRQIKLYIARHLRNAGLAPATVAAAFGLSTRQVHALFEPESMTVARYIRYLRTCECRGALESDPEGLRSLTDAAMEWGFYDLSHMIRCFRAEFGVTPSELRSAALQRLLSCGPPQGSR